ncbi:MAG: YceI family protein [Thiofilum sp.]|uniref:YceI family protein n=1 Tax=Thiofilum sp. TaxID=2212733 RepID=UPI0025CCC071|nr:YceI family protein [Thiofilum sp.]MBK8453491.1 YceI family protein [Thiofilum sp.]
MKKILCFALLASLGLPLNALAKPDQFSVAAANSEINYEVSYMQYNTSKGRFNDFVGVIVWDAEKPETSSVNITVQAKSVATGYPNIDRMLQGPDLFNLMSLNTP